MAPLTKTQFRDRHAQQAIDVARLPKAAAADLNRDGVVQGAGELDALFDLTDVAGKAGELELGGGLEAAGYRELTVLFRQTDRVEPALGNRKLSEVVELRAVYTGVPGACLEHFSAFGGLRTSAGTGSVQDALIELGIPLELGPHRGVYGDGTKAAVTRFQQEHGVADRYGAGMVGPETLAAIDAALHAKRTGAPAPAPAVVANGPSWLEPRPAIWPTVAAPADVVRKGSTGATVEWVQQRLIGLGFLPATTPMGTFGDQTERMLASYQAWNGLPTTGVADAATLQALSRVPERTPTGLARLEGGVSFQGLSEVKKAQYLKKVFDLNNVGGAPFNTLPGGVNFVQIRGFADGAAVQNVPERYDDAMFALVNGADGQPARVIELKANADYGDLEYELQSFGWGRPADAALGGVMGPAVYTQKGLGVSESGRVTQYVFGRHISGSSGVDRGMGLIDPVVGAHASTAFVDYNHNGQIDGAEWNHRVTMTGMNVHRGGDVSAVGRWSAGCHTLAVDGEYQRFTEVLMQSGQVQAYVDGLVQAGWSRSAAEAQVFGERRTDGVLDSSGRGAFMGPVGGQIPVRFSMALVDSRSLPPIE